MNNEQKQSIITIFKNGALEAAIEEVREQLSKDLFSTEAHKVKEREAIYHVSQALQEVKQKLIHVINQQEDFN